MNRPLASLLFEDQYWLMACIQETAGPADQWSKVVEQIGQTARETTFERLRRNVMASMSDAFGQAMIQHTGWRPDSVITDLIEIQSHLP